MPRSLSCDGGEPSWRETGLRTSLLAVTYFLAAKLGIGLATVGVVSPVWPPTGVAIAALLLWGVRVWPGIFVGELVAELTTGGGPLVWLGIPAGNTLQDLVCVMLLQRFARGQNAFVHASKYLVFVAISFLATTIGATIGTTVFALDGSIPWDDFADAWLTYWIGDALGIVILAPFFVLLLSSLPSPRLAWKERRSRAVSYGVLLGVSILIFGGAVPDPIGSEPIAFLVVPFVAWVALSTSRLGTATMVVTVSALAIAGTQVGQGPFGSIPREDALLLLQMFLGALTISGLGLAIAIDERVRLEVTAAQLRRSNEDLERFASAVAHDLKEPLGIMSGYLSLIERRGKDRFDEETRGFVTNAREGARRMGELVVNLLEFSRISSAARRGERTRLAEALGVAESTLAETLAQNGAQVLKEDDLPEVGLDRTQAVRLFQNLISNAVKFRRPGVPPRITVRARREGGSWHISLADNGIGIPEEDQHRVFEPFQRGRGAGVEGSGLGLAICKTIVERAGGTMWLESKEGVGSTFHFTLPSLPNPADERRS